MHNESPITCDVVLPYHNAALPYVAASIDSILNQQNARCIIHAIADAVSKEDEDIIKSLYRDASNIRFYRNETSIGQYQSVHKVFHKLESKYIAIQDSDDISLPHRLWHSVTEMQKHNADIFGASMENFIDWRSNGYAKADWYIENQGIISESGIKANYCPSGRVNNPTMVLTKQSFLKLNGFTDWRYSADNEFVERAHRAGMSFHYSPSVVVLRRIHKESIGQHPKTGFHTETQKKASQQLLARYEELESETDMAQFGSMNAFHLNSNEAL
jgi:hypothetical protein